MNARVRIISDGTFEDVTSTHDGCRFFDSGPTIVLEMDNDVTVVLTSRRSGNVSHMQFRSLGIKLETKQLIILKGVNAPRGAYREIYADLILADTRAQRRPTFLPSSTSTV